MIVGLGNIGSNYENNRHNIGFKVVDYIISEFSATKKGKKFKAELFQCNVNDTPVLIVKPQTYMNLSGESVQLILGFYKLKPTDLLVIYDDIDIIFNQIRFREKGSGGTHNGMKSIIGS
ncbi:aminoacyl-tRNA hydrolase, partial [Candidatus Marinamargulisbacteria bacterium SCGC AG-410-N11]